MKKIFWLAVVMCCLLSCDCTQAIASKASKWKVVTATEDVIYLIDTDSVAHCRVNDKWFDKRTGKQKKNDYKQLSVWVRHEYLSTKIFETGFWKNKPDKPTHCLVRMTFRLDKDTLKVASSDVVYYKNKKIIYQYQESLYASTGALNFANVIPGSIGEAIFKAAKKTFFFW